MEVRKQELLSERNKGLNSFLYSLHEVYKRRRIRVRQARVISITSGKGGVGKTNVVVNLATALSKMGKKVLVLDADLGLANVDVLLGIVPKYNLSHVIMGEKKLSEIVIDAPSGFKILPASSGVEEFTNLTPEQRERLFSEFSELDGRFDFILIDTAAGISSNVIHFNLAASEVIVVMEPEPASFTDAYAIIKVLSVKYDVKDFRILVNNVSSEVEAEDTFERMKMVTEKFLNVRISFLGYIFHDPKLPRAVRDQKAVVEAFPYSKASKCFQGIARSLCGEPKGKERGTLSGILKRFLGGLNNEGVGKVGVLLRASEG